MKNHETNELLIEQKVTAPMPSSGCNYSSSDSDQRETKPPHEIKERSILEALLAETKKESEVLVTFENVTGKNHKYRSEELVSRTSFPIDFKTALNKSKSPRLSTL